jgi:DNA-directed RNA polymerase alpha subunit
MKMQQDELAYIEIILEEALIIFKKYTKGDEDNTETDAELRRKALKAERDNQAKLHKQLVEEAKAALKPLGLSSRVSATLWRDYAHDAFRDAEDKRWQNFSIADLSACTDEFLMGIRNLGINSLKEIRQKQHLQHT